MHKFLIMLALVGLSTILTGQTLSAGSFTIAAPSGAITGTIVPGTSGNFAYTLSDPSYPGGTLQPLDNGSYGWTEAGGRAWGSVYWNQQESSWFWVRIYPQSAGPFRFTQP